MAWRFVRAVVIALASLAILSGDRGFAAPSGFARVLNDNDVHLYKQIFAAALAGDQDKVTTLSAQLENKSLTGHVSAKSFLSPKTDANFDALKSWLARYSDYPEAQRIYTLAQRKDPERAKGLKVPPRRIIRGNSDESEGGSEFASAQAQTAAKKVKSMLSAGGVNSATAYLGSAELKAQLSKADFARLTHQVAAGQFYLGDSATALSLAQRAANEARSDAPEADWIAGLAAFRLKQYDVAATHFAAMAENPNATSWLKTAAGFWAARSFLISGQPDRVSAMLEVSATKPRTFYGLLALHLLGRDPPFTWEEPKLEKAGFQRLTKVNGIARGIALFQIGELEAAEGAMGRAHGRLNKELDRPFIALAHEFSFANVQLVAAHGARDADLKAAAYPVMSIKPSDGWQVDPALVHAIVRQESKFEMRVTSSADARGLMQLMPATAAGTMKDTTLDDPGAKAKLFDPAFNLSIGQRYVKKMISFVEPNGDLIKLVVAYNGGPGNLLKWMKEVEHQNDPLLFVESLPSRETRGYVERVMANYWIYQDRLGEKKTTLDELARGEWPVLKWKPGNNLAMLKR